MFDPAGLTVSVSGEVQLHRSADSASGRDSFSHVLVEVGVTGQGTCIGLPLVRVAIFTHQLSVPSWVAVCAWSGFATM